MTVQVLNVVAVVEISAIQFVEEAQWCLLESSSWKE